MSFTCVGQRWYFADFLRTDCGLASLMWTLMSAPSPGMAQRSLRVRLAHVHTDEHCRRDSRRSPLINGLVLIAIRSARPRRQVSASTMRRPTSYGPAPISDRPQPSLVHGVPRGPLQSTRIPNRPPTAVIGQRLSTRKHAGQRAVFAGSKRSAGAGGMTPEATSSVRVRGFESPKLHQRILNRTPRGPLNRS